MTIPEYFISVYLQKSNCWYNWKAEIEREYILYHLVGQYDSTVVFHESLRVNKHCSTVCIQFQSQP